ncbi:hypothetical protein Tco_1237065 [Tanacetum coccineum]
MGYLVCACYSISPTRYYKDDSYWSADLKSMATEDIISIGSFLEVLVLNYYVHVRKILKPSVSGMDKLVQLVQETQHRKPSVSGDGTLYLAKITGGRSSGTVYVIDRNCLRSSEQIL